MSYTITLNTTKAEQAAGAGKTKNLEILKNLTGYANPGQALFIMGASGAGKTSLMNAISDRINVNKKNLLTGKIMVND